MIRDKNCNQVVEQKAEVFVEQVPSVNGQPHHMSDVSTI